MINSVLRESKPSLFVKFRIFSKLLPASPGTTGIPSLDAHLTFNSPFHVSSGASLQRGEVIEIQGPAASGKTHLSYCLTMRCTLPKDVTLYPKESNSYQTAKIVDIGGWHKSAVILDTDGRWSAQRLKVLFYNYLRGLFPPDYEEYQPTISELVDLSLNRVHIFRPTSTASLLATISGLPVYHAENMQTEEISLVAIDSISSFYWTDRYTSEQRHPSDKKENSSLLGQVLMGLQELRLRYGFVTMLNNWGLSLISSGSSKPGQSQTGGSSPFFRQHLHPFPAPFEIPARILLNANLFPPITLHITLSLPPISWIPSETATLQNANQHGLGKVPKTERTGILRIVENGKTSTFTFNIDGEEVV